MTVNSAGLSEAKAALLEKYLRGEMTHSATARHSIPHRPAGERVPLSFGQQQMWLLARMAPDVPVYTECVTVRLPGPLDVAALERSFNAFIRRHEIWRTTFSSIDGEPTQIIHSPMDFALPVVHMEELPEDRREAEALRLVTDDARLPFDLARGPLLRPRLIKLGITEHRLYVTLHHIIFDVVSLYSIFLPELAALYGAFSVGKPSPLTEPTIQYADYASWQRRQIQGETLEQMLPYWRERLADLQMLQLPTDHSRPAVQTFHGALQRFAFPKALTDDLKALSRREGASLYMTMVAAFITLLHRYAGQDDIVIGTPTSNRDRPEIEKTMGFFLNTLALRTNLGGNPTFSELVARVRSATLDVHAHRAVPFELVVRDLHPQRNFTHNPLFQVTFTLEPPRAPLDVPWSVEVMDIDAGTAKFDLSVELDETIDGMIGRVQYNADLFEAATITRMMEHFRVLLYGVVANPGQQISDLPLLADDERRQVLRDWNTADTLPPPDCAIHHIFEGQAARTPDAVAVVFEGQTLTYAQLNARANRLAHNLRTLGAGPEVLVGLSVERSLEMVVSILGILKAGSAYVPLDPTYPAERLGFILADTRVPILVTQARLVDTLPQFEGTLVCLDRDWETIAHASDANLASGVMPENLAYVIYTSGSTGAPKGVMVSHANVVRLFDATDEWFRFDHTDTWTLFHSYAFDFSVWEVWGALLHGGRLVVVPFWVSRSPEAFHDLLRTERVTVLNQTPSAFCQLIAVEEKRAVAPSLALRLVIFGGEALDPHVLRPWFARHGDRSPQLVNMYGITETTVHVTYYPLTTADLKEGSRNPIGRPIPDLSVYILGPHMQPVPIGVPGELYVGGAGVARGYLNRADLTAERFLIDPFDTTPGARLYKTGDRARHLPDGTIEYLGRLDEQVKIRGFRIEPGEIENALERHEGVHQAVVAVRGDVPGDKRLVAYIVPSQSPAPPMGDLRQALALQLPDYMIPSAFVPLETMPLTANGKVDRRALPAPSATTDAREASFVPPDTLLQVQLAQIWEEILDVRPIGITDDFFALGGHSFLAARLVDRIEEVSGKSVPLARLFAGATIAYLETVIQERTGEDAQAPVVRVQQGAGKRPFFFLHGDFMGGGLYTAKLAQLLDPDRPFYTVHPAGADGGPVPHTLAAIAAEHVKALRAIQPEGPYLLGGFCGGGYVAFETAQQLLAQGQEVEGLALVEPAFVHARSRVAVFLIRCWGTLVKLDPETQVRLFLRLRGHYTGRQTHPMGSGPTEMIGKILGTARKGLGWLARALRPGRPIVQPPLPPGKEATNAASRIALELEGRYLWAVAGYRPQPYCGRVALFWADDSTVKPTADLAEGWRGILEDIDVYSTPGTHFSVITTNAEPLAERIGIWLNAGEEARPSQGMKDSE